MAGAWTTLAILDGGGTSRTMRVWDESGTGAGPYSFGQVITTDAPGGQAMTFAAGATDVGTQRMTLANDSPGVTPLGQATMAASLPVTPASDQPLGYATTVTTACARNSGTTTTYTAGDSWSNSESAPTAGGYTISNAARISGGSGIITDLFIFSDGNAPNPLMQASLYILDSAGTAVNDNSPYTISDTDAVKLIGIIPFTLASIVGAGTVTGSFVHIQNLNVGFTCVGSANLRLQIMIQNAYVPVSAETITIRSKIVQTN